MAKHKVPPADDLFVIFRISNDLEYGERYYNICTSSKSFWYLNKYHVHRDYVIRVLDYIERTIRKKNAQAAFIPEPGLSL